MKKIWILLLAAALCLSVAACTQTEQPDTSSTDTAVPTGVTEKNTDSAVSDSSPSSGEDNVIDWGAGSDEFASTDTAGNPSSADSASDKTSEKPVSSSDAASGTETDTVSSTDTSDSAESTTQNSNEESSTSSSEYSRVVK